MTINPIKKGYTLVEFKEYMAKEKPTKFIDKGTAVTGVTLHNTWMPDLKRVKGYLDSKKWTAEQLIDNWWVSYRKMGWYSGPHLFIFPDKIYVATPLNVRGTHSPSYNKSFWGIEIVGNYDIEVLPPEMRKLAVGAAAEMFRALGVKASDKNFKFHGEDPKTTHKDCPGKNLDPKSKWIEEINALL
jgi:hypothetical protein